MYKFLALFLLFSPFVVFSKERFPQPSQMEIEESRRLVFELGKTEIYTLPMHVSLNLVGHSLGAIIAAEYAFNQKKWVENMEVKKVISIAGRLKNIEHPVAPLFILIAMRL